MQYPDLEKFKALRRSGPYFYKRDDDFKDMLVRKLKEFEIFCKNELGIEVYLIWGTLLAAVRDKDFIPFDKDIDVAFLSKAHNRRDVQKEFIEFCEVFRKQKRLWLKHYDHTFVWFDNSPPPRDQSLSVDVWVSWQDEDGRVTIPPYRVQKVDESWLLPYKKITFRGVEFLCPNNSEAILDTAYRSWTEPLFTRYKK